MRNKARHEGSADVIVVGGGCIGLAIARELARRGVQRVVIIERADATGTEASAAAAGMLAPQVEAEAFDPFFQLAFESRNAYPKFAAALLDETGIDIELDQTGILYLAFTPEDEADLQRRYGWQARAGLAVELLTANEARELEPHLSPALRAALHFPSDGQVENRRLVKALTAAAKQCGVRILTGTEVRAVHARSGRVQAVETSRGRLSSDVVVVAGGAWSSLIHLTEEDATRAQSPVPHIEPVRGQMLCFAASPPPVRHVIYGPHCYLVPRRDNRLLVGATVEAVGFDKSVTVDGVRSLTNGALEMLAEISKLKLTETWAGLRPRMEDGWPVLGQAAETEGLYYATGHYRNGILLTPLTARLIADLIVDKAASPLLEAFSVNRCNLVGAA